MKIDKATLTQNMKLAHGTATQSWGTSLGQKDEHRFTYPGCEEILVGMLHKRIDDLQNVKSHLGRGGADNKGMYSPFLAAKFDKVFANGVLIPDASFVLLIVTQLKAEGKAKQHIGRQFLKYGPSITYKGKNFNKDCFDRIAETLGWSHDAAWFVSDISVKNQDELHFRVLTPSQTGPMTYENNSERKEAMDALSASNRVRNKSFSMYNKIFYGVPGSGKSTYIKKTILKDVPDDGKHIFRTTFHPEYSNSDFVGQIMPKIEKDETGKDIVTYSFVPGPFALALKETYTRDEMIYLVIEEINRGNASAIFGDIFQLLDRVKDSDDPKYGESEFPITNVALQDYLSKELGHEIKEIKIPSNLTILATMNTSDQNVFTMDTAFKRRWSFEQIDNEFGDDHPYKNWYVPGTNVTWEAFLNKTNEAILDFKIANSSNEDKRMGKYFVTKDCLTENENTDSPETAKNFAYKVLEYLWNDVCKFNREEMFDTANNKTLEELIKHFAGDEHLSIFVNPNFRDQN